MKRKEIKDLLFELGASPRLLEMPAVMERIYNYYINYSEEQLKDEINIGSNGEILCQPKQYDGGIVRSFKVTEKGETIFENNEQQGIEQRGLYFIDEFGMDRIFKDCSEPLFEKECSVVRTEERKLVLNNGIRVVEDQGDPILNYNNFTIFWQNASRTIGWDGNKDFLTKYYPITREWFAIREGIRIEDADEKIEAEHNDEVENLKSRIRTIEEKHQEETDKLIKENNKLKEEKISLQIMLKRTLEVCESVKRSPLGKVFFGRKLKQLPEVPDIEER